MRICKKCNSLLKDDIEVCPNCGGKSFEDLQTKECKFCGEQIAVGTIVCPHCHRIQPPENFAEQGINIESENKEFNRRVVDVDTNPKYPREVLFGKEDTNESKVEVVEEIKEEVKDEKKTKAEKKKEKAEVKKQKIEENVKVEVVDEIKETKPKKENKVKVKIVNEVEDIPVVRKETISTGRSFAVIFAAALTIVTITLSIVFDVIHSNVMDLNAMPVLFCKIPYINQYFTTNFFAYGSTINLSGLYYILYNLIPYLFMAGTLFGICGFITLLCGSTRIKKSKRVMAIIFFVLAFVAFLGICSIEFVVLDLNRIGTSMLAGLAGNFILLLFSCIFFKQEKRK